MIFNVTPGSAVAVALQMALAGDSFTLEFAPCVDCRPEDAVFMDFPGCDGEVTTTNSPVMVAIPGLYRVVPNPANSARVFLEVGHAFPVTHVVETTMLGS